MKDHLLLLSTISSEKYQQERLYVARMMKKFKKIFEIWDSCSSGRTVNNLGYFSLVPCSVIGLLKTLKDLQFITSNHNHTINIFLFSTDYLTTDSFWLHVFCLLFLAFNKSIKLLFLYMNGLMDFYRIQNSKSVYCIKVS